MYGRGYYLWKMGSEDVEHEGEEDMPGSEERWGTEFGSNDHEERNEIEGEEDASGLWMAGGSKKAVRWSQEVKRKRGYFKEDQPQSGGVRGKCAHDRKRRKYLCERNPAEELMTGWWWKDLLESRNREGLNRGAGKKST